MIVTGFESKNHAVQKFSKDLNFVDFQRALDNFAGDTPFAKAQFTGNP